MECAVCIKCLHPGARRQAQRELCADALHLSIEYSDQITCLFLVGVGKASLLVSPLNTPVRAICSMKVLLGGLPQKGRIHNDEKLV